MRGIAERIDAVVWFSDLRGFTRITDTEPEQVISLLNDYSDVIVSTIQEHGGDVLKLIGDGTPRYLHGRKPHTSVQCGIGCSNRSAPRRR